MKVSYNWLQKLIKDKLPDPAKVAEMLIFHAFEVESVQNIGDDYVFDIKVLPNRAHDCLSHLGIAKEIALIGKYEIEKPDAKNVKIVYEKNGLGISVEDTKACDRYIGVKISGINVADSPNWLKKSLEAVGQRSINNVVDAANYVMLTLGQPLHAFDSDKLHEIRIRHARENEQITTLDAKQIKLSKESLVIADGENALAIAGIKGGKSAEIDQNTRNIIIESAHFNPTLIRQTSFRIGLRTDASQRFENEISPELAEYGARMFAGLVLDLAGGKIDSAVDINNSTPAKPIPTVTADEVNKLLGTQFTGDDIKSVIERLDTKYRMDLEQKADVIEEIGRVLGYEKVGETKISEEFDPPKSHPAFFHSEELRQRLTALGYNEVILYSFSEKGKIELLNPLQSQKPYLRSDLSTNFLQTFDQNKWNVDLLGLQELKMFEIGVVFNENGEELRCILASSGKSSVANDIPWQGAVNLCKGKGNVYEFSIESLIPSLPTPRAYDSLGRNYTEGVMYRKYPPYPSITRDVALFVPDGVQEEKIASVISESAGTWLARAPRCFDRFEKTLPDGVHKVSYAFRLVFQSPERTLTNDEINGVMNGIENALKTHEGWQIR